MKKNLLRRSLTFFSLGAAVLLSSLAHKAEAQTYCTPSPAGANNYIVEVSTSGALSDFSRTSGNEYYTNNTTTHSASVIAGNTFTITVNTCGTGSVWCSPSYAKIWIDWNDDGDFTDAGEEVYYYEPSPYTSGAYNFVASVTVPLDAVIGDLRMRIYTDWFQAPSSGYTSIAPCASTSWGEVEDYGIIVIAATPCEDVVVDAGALVAPSEVCPSVPFSIANPTIEAGMGATVTWQYRSPAGSGAWTTISGVSTFGYTVPTGITEATEYRSFIVCAAGGTSDTTAPITIAMSPFADCYCEPSPGGGDSYIIMASTTGGASNFSRSSGNEYYSDLTGSYEVSQIQGSEIDFSVNVGGSAAYCKIWVDWNQDGSFTGAGEEVYYFEPYPTTGGANSFSGTITVPASALPGVTRMRIYTDYMYGPYYGYPEIAPCSSTIWGEVEDYSFVVISAEPCEAAEAGALTGVSEICSSEPLTISWTGSTLAGGLTRIWQSRPVGSTTWTTIAGAVGTSLPVSSGILEPTEYRAIITCDAEGLSDTTAIHTVGISPGVDCYCEPYPAGGNNYITSASTTDGATNFSRTSGNEHYSNLSSTHEVSQVQGLSINFNVTTYGSPSYCKIWVDWNQDGSFTGAGEEVYYFEPYPATGGASSFSGTITVPEDAVPGNTRMRIYTDWYYAPSSGYTAIAPCASTTWGEVEDYGFVVISAEPCEAAEAGALTGVSEICSSEPLTISWTGSTLAGGLTRIWQSRPEGTSTWTTIAGESGATLSIPSGITEATEYRAIITCDAEGLSDTTAIHTVGISPGVDCYCEPYPVGGNNYITSASTTDGATNFSRTSGNEHYSNLSSTHEVSQVQGLSINFNVTTYGSPSYCKIWVDWNQDGSFTGAGEEVYYFEPYPMTGGASSFSGTITVPTDALPGNTRMRIYTDWYYAPSSGYTAIAPCASTSWGEIEDYGFVVVSAVPCDVAEAGALTGVSAICSSEPLTISWTGSTLAGGLTRIWQSRPVGSSTWTTIAGATSTSLSIPSGITEATEYRAIITCDAEGLSDTTAIHTVGISPGVDCYCEPYPAGGNNYITSASTTGGATNFSRTSGDEHYSNLSSTHVVTQTQGLDIDFSVTTYGSPSYCKVWVDWNQDGSFTGAGEEVYYFEPYPMTGGAYSFSGTITVPADAVPGSTRMRIYTDWYYAPYYGYPEIEPCSSTDWGEIEDYGFVVVSSCSPTPTAIATGSGPICAGDTLNLFASSDIGTLYTWTGPAGFTSTDQNPVITATTTAMSGNYIVTVTEPSNGCTRKDTVNVVINPSPAAITLSPSVTDICPGTSLAISATGGSGGTFVWTPVGGITSGTGGSVYTVSPTASLTKYTASVTNTFGCVTVSDTATVIVNPIPAGLVGVSPTTCATANGYITITGLVTGESYTVSYTRDGTAYESAPITSVFNTVTVTGLPAGSYTAIYVTRVSTGCSSTNLFATTLASPSPPPFTISAAEDPIECGAATGSISFSGMTNSTAFTLHYKKDGVAVTPIPFTSSATGTYNLTGLTAAEYTDIYITRVSSSCTSASLTQTLEAPEAPIVTIVGSEDPSGCGAADGSITFAGLEPGELYTIDYIYEGAPSMYSDFADALGQGTMPNLSGGFYSNIVVTNSASCGALPLSIELDDPIQDALVVTPTVAQSCADVIHTITIAGGALSGLAPTYAIAPIDGLYLDAEATVPYTGGSVTEVYAQPSANTTYTITATAGTCIATATAEIGVLSPDNTAQLATEDHNGIDLSIACEQEGWTYYTDPTDPDMPFLIGINWGTGNESAKAAAVPTLQVDPEVFSVTDEATSMATFTMNRYWNVDLGTETLANPVSIRFFYDAAELTAVDAEALAFATLTGGDIEPSTWFKLDGEAFSTTTSTIDEDKVHNAIPLIDVAAGATLNGIAYAQFDGITSFSGGGYAAGVGPGSPLQTKLGQFTAQAKEGYNQLDWNSLYEENGDYFQLHKSIDGQSFTIIANIEGQGRPSNYTYRDMQPQSGRNFYQLAMHSLDGRKQLSDIIMVEIDNKLNNQVSVYPNPTSDEVVLQVQGHMAANAKVVLTDLSGRVLAEFDQFEQNTIRIDMKPYAQGLYMIRYQDDAFSHTVKVTRQ